MADRNVRPPLFFPLCVALRSLRESISGCSMLVRDLGSSVFFVANFPIRAHP